MFYSLLYTDKVPEGSAGYASMWFIRIRPEYKDDKGLLEHEICHVKNFWLNFFVSAAILTGIAFGIYHFYPSPYVFCPIPLSIITDWALYKIPRFRLWEEVKCFRVQMEYAEDKEAARQAFALRLATHYDLGITVGEALYALGG